MCHTSIKFLPLVLKIVQPLAHVTVALWVQQCVHAGHIKRLSSILFINNHQTHVTLSLRTLITFVH